METELTSILDKVAPRKTGHRNGPRKVRNWLAPEAVDAEKRRRRLERRWRVHNSNAELDRLAYRAVCSSANKLILWLLSQFNSIQFRHLYAPANEHHVGAHGEEKSYR